MESATQNVKQLHSADTRQYVPGAPGTTHMQGVHKVSHPDWEEVCKQCCTCDKDVGHCAANSSDINGDTSYAPAGTLSNAKETTHNTNNSVMVHNT